jgi:hypothetical protein
MNKTNNMLMIFVILLIGLLAQAAYVSADSALSVSVSKYEPYPASPGQTVKVWLLVQNTGSDAAKDITVTLLPQYPFTLYGDTTTSKSIHVLGAKTDYLIDYNIKVDENAVEGNNILKVKIRDGTGTATEVETDVSIYVQSRDSTVSIDSVKITPSQIEPGSDGKVTISVKNMAPVTLTDLTLKLYLQATVGGTIIDLPFAPVDSNAEKRIYKIDPGETAEFSYNLRAYPDAVSKIYKIPFSLSYYDPLGNQKNKTDFIGVIVNSIPDVTIYIDKTDLLQQKRAGSLTLKVINKGLSDIKFLNVILGKSDDYDILSNSDTTYVGNLVSDDYQTVEYKVNLLTSKNELTLPVTLQYRDANNKVYNMVENVPLKLLDSTKLNDANKAAGGSIIITVIVAVVIIVLVFLFIRSRNKKNKKAQF